MKNSITLSILFVTALFLVGCDQDGGLVSVENAGSEQETALARTADKDNEVHDPGALYERSFVHDGVPRSYLLYVPAAYDGEDNWPLVINYHGYSIDGAFQKSIDNMDVVADAAHFLLAYPDGLIVDDPFDGPGLGWNYDGLLSQNDDVDFTSALIDHVMEDFVVDPARVHVTGFSMGAQMIWGVACRLSDRIASVGGVAGLMNNAFMEACDPARPFSVMHLIGTEDIFFPPEGIEVNGYVFSNPKETTDFWARQNNCSPDPLSKDLKDVVTDDNSTVTRFKYIGCDDRTEVLYYRVNNGGHTWPQGSFPGGTWPEFLGPVNQDISASAEIWDFFARNPHPGTVQVCHAPPGNPSNARTITVSINALPAHLAHGDREGPCDR